MWYTPVFVSCICSIYMAAKQQLLVSPRFSSVSSDDDETVDWATGEHLYGWGPHG